ncbi:MAG: 3-dehydroquinate synthase [Gemmatimonadaceae bacterium]
MATVSLLGYEILVEPGALARLGDLARAAAPAHRYAIVTDDAVGPLYAERAAASFGRGARVDVFTVPAGETHKTRESWARLTDALLTAGYGRDSAVVALGGGVVGDLAGFVAATFMRGVPVVQVPTTLLAMIDASIGGKTGVDTPQGKNLVGAFHQPAAVVADTDVLATLPPAHLRAGLAEAIKHGVIASEEYFESVLAALPSLLSASGAKHGVVEVVAGSVRIKADVVRRDVREGGLRKVLNFGHTVGHAVEHLSGYAMLHGEAVAVGMAVESALAERVGVAERGTARRVREAVRAAGLPAAPPPDVARLGAAAVLDATRADKKARAGRVEYALPCRVGAMAGEREGWSLPIADEEALAEIGRALEGAA